MELLDPGKAHYARVEPLLKELGFRATLFVYTDYIGTGASALTWQALRDLAEEGFDVQAHSKTHADLRHRNDESDAQYAKRMESELGVPLALFRKHLGRTSESLAYPFGATDEELMQHVAQQGYVAAFTVTRQASPAFVFPLRIGRAQIYAEMALPDFARNLTVFHDEAPGLPLADNRTSAEVSPVAGTRTSAMSTRHRLAASNNERADDFERRGYLRQALEERTIALTIDPQDAAARAALSRLQSQIEREVATLIQEGRGLLGRGLHREARQRFLAVLALEPTNRAAFEALQHEVREAMFLVHKVRPGETLASVADLYYGDQLRADVIGEANQLSVNEHLAPGREIRIPEIPGVPFLPR